MTINVGILLYVGPQIKDTFKKDILNQNTRTQQASYHVGWDISYSIWFRTIYVVFSWTEKWFKEIDTEILGSIWTALHNGTKCK